MEYLKMLNQNILWGIPMLILMLAAGVYLTFVTKGVIFRRFGFIMKSTIGSLFKKNPDKNEGAVSPFAAVSTALAATVGTGNIVGVAIAIRVGGPGAIFWMWVTALIGMVTKYSEVTLAVHFREKNYKGEYVGGPMYYMTNGLKLKGLASVFCVFAILSSFGIGNMVQANALAGGLKASFHIEPWITGIFVAAICGCVLIGGIKRISSVAEVLVPFMAFFYIAAAAVVLFINAEKIPDSFMMIIRSAFTGSAAAGGFAGAAVMYSIRIGSARGLFTNEAGLGSAPIAHAAADTDHPSKQGMWGAFEVFFDTIVMCTVTALVIISSGIWMAPAGFDDNSLTNAAFSQAFAGGGHIVSITLVLFTFATIIAWYYYGEKCVEYLFGKKAISFYRVIFVAATFYGCIANLEIIWEMSDTLNALMAIPNLIALLLLAPVVGKITKEFFNKRKK